MSGLMDEVDNRRMLLRWRSKSWEIVRREDEVAKEEQWKRGAELCLQFIVVLQLHQLHLQGARGVVHGQVQGAVENLKSTASALTSAKLEANSSGREATTLTCVQVHVVRGTSSKVRKIHKLTNSQLSLPQAQLNLEGGDVRVHVCHENFFALQLHVEGVQVCSDVCEQDQQASLRLMCNSSMQAADRQMLLTATAAGD